MEGGLGAVVEDAGAFEGDVDVAPGQGLGVALGGDADRAAADIDAVAGDGDPGGEAAVHAVVAQQMRVGFDGAEIVDGDHLDIGAAGFYDGAQHVTPDAAEAVDGNFHCHGGSPSSCQDRWSGLRRMPACRRLAASARILRHPDTGPRGFPQAMPGSEGVNSRRRAGVGGWGVKGLESLGFRDARGLHNPCTGHMQGFGAQSPH